MVRINALLLLVVLWAAVTFDQQVLAGPARRGATIISPKRNSEVERAHEVSGKMNVPGQPVVLVRSGQGDGTWWIQPTPTLGERGYFKAQVRFGSPTSRHGERFSLVVIVLQSPADIEYLRDRDSLPEIPNTIWQSDEVTVVLRDTASKDYGPVATSAAILKPQPDEKVSRVTELVGRVPEQLTPLVLVWVEDNSGLWWVQDPVLMGKSGYFTCAVCFGNDTTPTGTRFRVVIVTPRSGEEAAGFTPGMSIADLPDGIPRSKEVVVELARPNEQGADGAE